MKITDEEILNKIKEKYLDAVSQWKILNETQVDTLEDHTFIAAEIDYAEIYIEACERIFKNPSLLNEEFDYDIS